MSRKGEPNPNAGRPWFNGKPIADVLSDLKSAWSYGATDKLACSHAKISVPALQRYFDEFPELREQRDWLRDTPKLKAIKTIVGDLDKIDSAKWYAERKMRHEFATRVEQTGADGRNLNTGFDLDDPELLAIKNKAEEELRQLYKSRLKKVK
jgi:hypothetical protein